MSEATKRCKFAGRGCVPYNYVLSNAIAEAGLGWRLGIDLSGLDMKTECLNSGMPCCYNPQIGESDFRLAQKMTREIGGDIDQVDTGGFY